MFTNNGKWNNNNTYGGFICVYTIIVVVLAIWFYSRILDLKKIIKKGYMND